MGEGLKKKKKLYIGKIIRVLGPYRALFLYDKVFILISPKGFEKLSQ